MVTWWGSISEVTCQLCYHLHGPYKYIIHKVIACVTNDDYNNIDVIKVQSAGVFWILNLISYIVEHSSDDCFMLLFSEQAIVVSILSIIYISMWLWWWCPLCIEPTHLDWLYCASSQKQQSYFRCITPLRHVILIQS